MPVPAEPEAMSAKGPALGRSSVRATLVGPGRASPHPLSTLQARLGNRATASLLRSGSPSSTALAEPASASSNAGDQVVQRARVPEAGELAVLLPPGGANLPAHLEGLRRVVENTLSEPRAGLKLTPEQRARVGQLACGALSAEQFQALPEVERLTRLAGAIQHVRADRVVADPALMGSAARAGTPDAANIQTLVVAVTQLIDDVLGAGMIDLWLTQIFGATQVGAAKARYRAAQAMLNTLAANGRILSDRSGYSAEASLGGSTVVGNRIELEPATIDNPQDLHSQVLTLHEAMHAGTASIGDFGYLGTAGFTAMAESDKVNNAAHYEVAAYRLREPTSPAAYPIPASGAVGFLTFVPASSSGPGATLTVPEDARNHASDVIENAWSATLDLYDQWAALYHDPSLWPGLQDELTYWSSAENLTVHARTVNAAAAARAPDAPVTAIDLALSETLSGRIMEVESLLTGDPVAFEAAYSSAAERAGATDLSGHRDLLVLCAVRASGLSLTGPSDRDARVLIALGEAKANGSLFVSRPPAFP